MRCKTIAMVVLAVAVMVGCGKDDGEQAPSGNGTGGEGADVELYKKFAEAIYAGDMAKVREMADDEKALKARGAGGETPLIAAIMCSKPDIAILLIEKGIDVNAAGKSSGTPLWNCKNIKDDARRIELAKLLIEKGADVNAMFLGQAPLHWAAQVGVMDYARLLLNNGADVNIKDTSGLTPLHYAASSGKPKMARLLVEKGADPKLKDKEGKTPLDWARNNMNKDVVEVLK